MGRKRVSGGTPSGEADAVTLTVREFYRLGQRAMSYVKENPGRRSLGVFADLEQRHIDMVRKAKRFAERFTSAQLEWLCDKRDSSGAPLGWTYAAELTRIRTARQRKSLLAKALATNLSRVEFGELITQELGEKGSEGGRALKEPTSAHALLQQLVSESERWCRRFSKIWASEDGRLKLEGLTEGKERTQLAEVRDLVTRAHQALAEVQTWASRGETQLTQFDRRLRV